jgi:hypothetical protein
VLPRFFGDVHTFSERGYWGQPFFPDGFPYLLTLYLGPGLLWLALRSSPGGEKARLLTLCVLGVLLALGSRGPLEWVLAPLMRHFRAPPKFLFTSTLALCLLAARGLDRARRGGWRPSWWAVVPAASLAGLYPLLKAVPELPGRLLGASWPAILDPRAQLVIARDWPAAFGTAGALLVGAVLALRSQATAPLAGLLLGLDLLIANGSVNLTATPDFYELRPSVGELVARGRAEGTYRWFAYGAAQVQGLRWAPEVAARNADVSLYYVERQSLLPRTQVLDALDGAFDEDRVGWAPRGSTLGVGERVPALFRDHKPLLRLANVRFVVSFRPLPADLVRLRGEARLAEVLEPLRVYELLDPLPRAFRVDRFAAVPEAGERERLLRAADFDPRSVVLLEAPPPAPPAAPGSRLGGAPATLVDVTHERLDPHTVRLRVPGPPGLVVVAEGYHADWRADANGERRAVLRANGRYWAIPSAGGGETLTVRFLPAWRPWALAAFGLGALVAFVLLVRPLWTARG